VDIIADVVGTPVAVPVQTEHESAAMLSRHLPDVWVRQIIADWRHADGAAPAISDEYTRITGKPSRTFRQWVEDHVDLFA
jgi:hypothetical protein